MGFALDLSAQAVAVLDELASDPSQAVKVQKIPQALARLESNPRHPGLNTHKYQSKRGPGGEAVWEAYVENQTPRAWRIWFMYGPGRDVISVLSIGPHPD